MQEEADGVLLYYMSCRECEAERQLSDRAAVEFNRRYARALFGRCRRICKTLGVAEDFALDLVSYTFIKAVENADRFVDVPDSPAPSRRTLGWLGTVARNLLVDSLRNPKRPGSITGGNTEVRLEDYSDAEFAALLCDGKSLARDLRTIELVRQALPTLDDRARAILGQTVLQRQISPNGSYMYRGSAIALAERFNTTRENIRRIRRQGIRTLVKYVQEHSK